MNILFRQGELEGARFQEKLLSSNYVGSVPQTNTGGRVEKTKTNE